MRIRLFPRGLAGQLTMLLLGALVVAQTVAFQVVHDERKIAQRTVYKSQVLERIAAASRLILESPAELRPQILRALQTEDMRFWISTSPLVTVDPADEESLRVQRRLAGLLSESYAELRLRIQTELPDAPPPPPHMAMHRDLAPPPPPDADDRMPRSARGWRRCIDETTGFVDVDCVKRWRATRGLEQQRNPFVIAAAASMRLPDSLWLNAETSLDMPPLQWGWPSLLTFVLSALLIAAVAVVTVRRITRPLNRLAAAAEKLGRGEAVADVPETGPDQFRATTRAFNLMNRRLQRFVSDRMRFLAAVSHDLRTPLTSLRLRSEFIDDDETRTRMLATLDEMTQMVDAVLDFVREDTRAESTDRVDFASLVESVCDDFSDLGLPVELTPPPKLPEVVCRPLSIKRALRNLIDNAVKYGNRAVVSVEAARGGVTIHVDDDGPGLTDAEIERIFDPFVRIESSRNRETGGVGLGLSIARSIAQSHGGRIAAARRAEGGMRMSLFLPL
ncbi:ATPase, histidine kinase-, DNA gyrase B-, and HSP90-like domain protein [uncultured Alphaproteobacteria bacterium]|uniref:histidine kinase n=1 Tax=uncultured Alphaproteobacteria bacterium TaxID=91750 RepID=A0A212JI25_9PROT|nr:ATPase, histidine kinase-, DNA gyrase B-, and HSP90-like domain protein [uncultured Alphaproteobacteria bacterium]